MKTFEDVRGEVLTFFGDWIKIRDYRSKWTIEDFPYDMGVDETLTSPHCWQCVTVNKCWFKDEEGKKPKEFDNSRYSLIDLPLSKRGLYHPNCHCWKHKMPAPRSEKYCFDSLLGKINYFFKDKIDWFYSWGYKDNDKASFVDMVLALTYESYSLGHYENIGHDKYGFKINVFIKLLGKHEKKGHVYHVKTCWMIFPNGKLKCNTLIGGRVK